MWFQFFRFSFFLDYYFLFDAGGDMQHFSKHNCKKCNWTINTWINSVLSNTYDGHDDVTSEANVHLLLLNPVLLSLPQ